MSSTTSTVKPNKASALASVRSLIAGTQKHSPDGSLTFGNATYTPASLVQKLQTLVDAMTAHEAEQAKAKDVIAALREASTTVRPIIQAYRRFLIATYGNATEVLADYGLKPPKARAPRTSAQKAVTASKVEATRKARGTTSKKQKATIHGVVPATTVTPAAPPAPPGPKPTA